MSDPVARLNTALEGRYAIERELGEGGMATVYLADDLKHQRKVALKVLKPELAAVIGAERFLAEIRTTANLQHPHILPLFDSGEVDGLLYYIMPFIDGESLRDKLKRETQLSLKEALEITEALAGALDHAHRHGVVHRDIKPANILLHEGQPLVADFGIALAVSVAAGDRITETGLSLGTPPYMSPEQAAAERELDGRSDQYSLACVLYEMLAGQPPFNAPTAQATVAQILAVDPPPLTERRRTVPAGVAAAVHRALEKVPADRFDTAGDFTEALTTGEYWTPVEARGAVAPGSPQSPTLVRTLAATLVVVGALAVWGWLRPSIPPPGNMISRRIVIPVPTGQQLSIPQRRALPFALSPDGSLLVYAAVREGRTNLYLRPLDDFESTELAGTEGAKQPFFSWDGTQIGFFANGQLQRVPVDGGAPFQIAEVPDVPQGASWGPNDTIIYSARTEVLDDTTPYRTQELLKVSAAGGEPEPLELNVAATQGLGVRVLSRTWPHHLPDGEHLLVTIGVGITARTVVASLASGDLTPAVDGRQGQYLPGGRSSGHIVYTEPGERVRAVAFDLASLQVTGDPFPLFENVFRGAQEGGSFIRVSRSGSAVYVAGGFERSLVLVEQTGREVLLTEERLGYRFPRFSPDGTRVAVAVDPRPSTLWLFDVGSGVGSPIGSGLMSFWNPANGRLYAGMASLVERWPLTSRPDTAVIWPLTPSFPMSWSRDGLTLISMTVGVDTGKDLWHVQLGDGVSDTLMATPFEEPDGKLSPDGTWLAFESALSGRPEIYLATYPDLRDRQRVSSGGGQNPLWSYDSSEIYYRSGDRVMAVQISLGSSASVSPPDVLFRGDYDNSQPLNWDVDAQGRFLMVRPAPGTFGQFQLVSNLAAELAGNE